MACRIGLLALAMILAAVAPGGAQDGDEAKWKQAYADFQRFGASKEATERAKAAEVVGEATFGKHDKQAVQMIMGLLTAELDRGKNGKEEEKVSGEVLQACVNALRKVNSKEAVDSLINQAKNKGGNPRFRFYIVMSLATQKSALPTLIALVDDKEPVVQIAAVDALVEAKDPSALDTFIKVLSSPQRGWESKLSAVNGIEKLDDKSDKAIDGLIASLDKLRADEARVKAEVIRLLGKYLGVTSPKTDDPGWWREAKKNKDAPVKEGQTMSEPTKFFGLETKSSRIVFILDVTGSMSDPLTWTGEQAPPGGEKKDQPTGPEPPGKQAEPGGKKLDPTEEAARIRATELKKKLVDEKKVATRMDGLKKELVGTIYGLDKKVQFAIVWYEGNTKNWKDQMVYATWVNKLACIEDIDKKSAMGPTNIWGGLETAFRFVEVPGKPDLVVYDKEGKYAAGTRGADTFFLMTDGRHNTGKFVMGEGPDETAFIGELKKINALRKVIVHTIALGDFSGGQYPMNNGDVGFMEKLAKETGGNAVHIGKK